MASKKIFLEFPAVEYCTTSLFLGPPRSGKTYIALQSIREFIRMGMFEKYYMILPNMKNEADKSYDWLLEHDNVTIYESFYEDLCEAIITEQEKNNALFDKGKITEKPRVLFFVDDATSQGVGLFKSKTMVRFATENRHLNIHSFFCMHYDKGVLAPKIRNNLHFVFIYPVQLKLLKRMHEDYVPVKFKELRDFKTQFLPFWEKYIETKEYGCLLIATKKKYNPFVCDWFKDTEEKKEEEIPEAEESK
jgi:hypothetical protein